MCRGARLRSRPRAALLLPSKPCSPPLLPSPATQRTSTPSRAGLAWRRGRRRRQPCQTRVRDWRERGGRGQSAALPVSGASLAPTTTHRPMRATGAPIFPPRTGGGRRVQGPGCVGPRAGGSIEFRSGGRGSAQRFSSARGFATTATLCDAITPSPGSSLVRFGGRRGGGGGPVGGPRWEDHRGRASFCSQMALSPSPPYAPGGRCRSPRWAPWCGCGCCVEKTGGKSEQKRTELCVCKNKTKQHLSLTPPAAAPAAAAAQPLQPPPRPHPPASYPGTQLRA